MFYSGREVADAGPRGESSVGSGSSTSKQVGVSVPSGFLLELLVVSLGEARLVDGGLAGRDEGQVNVLGGVEEVGWKLVHHDLLPWSLHQSKGLGEVGGVRVSLSLNQREELGLSLRLNNWKDKKLISD